MKKETAGILIAAGIIVVAVAGLGFGTRALTEGRVLADIVREEKVATERGVYTIQVFESSLPGRKFGIEVLDPNGEQLHYLTTRVDSIYEDEAEALAVGALTIKEHVLGLQTTEVRKQIKEALA